MTPEAFLIILDALFIGGLYLVIRHTRKQNEVESCETCRNTRTWLPLTACEYCLHRCKSHWEPRA